MFNFQTVFTPLSSSRFMRFIAIICVAVASFFTCGAEDARRLEEIKDDIFRQEKGALLKELLESPWTGPIIKFGTSVKEVILRHSFFEKISSGDCTEQEKLMVKSSAGTELMYLRVIPGHKTWYAYIAFVKVDPSIPQDVIKKILSFSALLDVVSSEEPQQNTIEILSSRKYFNPDGYLMRGYLMADFDSSKCPYLMTPTSIEKNPAFRQPAEPQEARSVEEIKDDIYRKSGRDFFKHFFAAFEDFGIRDVDGTGSELVHKILCDVRSSGWMVKSTPETELMHVKPSPKKFGENFLFWATFLKCDRSIGDDVLLNILSNHGTEMDNIANKEGRHSDSFREFLLSKKYFSSNGELIDPEMVSTDDFSSFPYIMENNTIVKNPEFSQ